MVIMFQSLTHTHDIIDCIAEPTVKLNDSVVGSPNLQIDFGTTSLPQQSFGFHDDGSRIPATPQLRGDGQVVKPASVALVTSHHAGDNQTVKDAHQKQVRSDAKFALNVSAWVVPRPNQITLPPKCHDCLLVVWVEWADLHECTHLLAE
jgi:hypothetical protein